MTRIRGFAASTIAMYKELLSDDPSAFGEDDANLLTLLRAWNGKGLEVNDGNREAIRSALTDLSNTEDEIAESERKTAAHRRDTERMRHSRAASDGLSRVRV